MKKILLEGTVMLLLALTMVCAANFGPIVGAVEVYRMNYEFEKNRAAWFQRLEESQAREAAALKAEQLAVN